MTLPPFPMTPALLRALANRVDTRTASLAEAQRWLTECQAALQDAADELERVPTF